GAVTHRAQAAGAGAGLAGTRLCHRGLLRDIGHDIPGSGHYPYFLGNRVPGGGGLVSSCAVPGGRGLRHLSQPQAPVQRVSLQHLAYGTETRRRPCERDDMKAANSLEEERQALLDQIHTSRDAYRRMLHESEAVESRPAPMPVMVRPTNHFPRSM